MPTAFKVALSIGCAYILYKVSGTLIHSYLVAKMTVLNELSEIGPNSIRKSDKLRGIAVICGGSITGLLAAKICSDHFESVIIVEQEEWVTLSEEYTGPKGRKDLASKKRSHVHQYNAAHLYQPLLARALIKWFPNLKEESEKFGGRIIPLTGSTVFSGLPFSVPSYPDDVLVLRLDRPGFETLLRRLVMKSCNNVEYLAGNVLGLEKAEDANMVAGVRVRTSKGEEITLPAVLAIDCTGASSAGLRWLKELASVEGNKAALKNLNDIRETYNPKQSYRTCEFDVPPTLVPQLMEVGFPADWDISGAFFTNAPDPKMDNKLFGIARKVHNFLEFTLGGWSVPDPINNVQDIRSYISSLNVYKPLPTWISRVLDILEENEVPLTVDSSSLGPAVYIQYNLYENMPSNFIAMGDSVMRLNPVRGVGCTKACIEALILNKVLNNCHSRKGTTIDQLPKDFSKKFHKSQASRIGPDWNGYKAEDYEWETTVPAKGDDIKTYAKFQRAFGRLVIQKALRQDNDNDFAVTVGYIRGYLAPPIDLFAPRILFKLLKVKLFDRSPLL